MGNTSIEWTDKTWNPTRGCSRVSEGCRNCYAERQAIRHRKGHYEGLITIVNGHPAWTGEVRLIESALTAPLQWREPKKVFVNSMSDLFHEQLTDQEIDRTFAVMALCPRHTFQILTKRAERMLNYASNVTSDRLDAVIERVGTAERPEHFWPLQNVWLGVSAENQETANERVPLLLQTPATMRFVSYEPALGPVSFEKWSESGLECGCGWRGVESECSNTGPEDDSGFACPTCGELTAHLPLDERLDWIIVGGESGPGARPFDIGWARNTLAQCKAAGVACFVKQLGAKPTYPPRPECAPVEMCLYDRKGGDWNEWPEDLRVREFPQMGAIA